jgi:hypothetical protein
MIAVTTIPRIRSPTSDFNGPVSTSGGNAIKVFTRKEPAMLEAALFLNRLV